MKTININQLTNLLMGLPKDTLAKVTTVTNPKLKKTGNPYPEGSITKRTVSTVMLNYSYGDEVNRERAFEGKEFDFQPKARAWGERIANTPLVTNNGKLYLDCRFMEAGKSEYLNEGQPIDKTAIESWLPETKSGAAKQGLNEANEVVVRSYSVTSIVEMELNNETYSIQ